MRIPGKARNSAGPTGPTLLSFEIQDFEIILRFLRKISR